MSCFIFKDIPDLAYVVDTFYSEVIWFTFILIYVYFSNNILLFK